MSNIEVGKTYTGTVKAIKPFGAFVECVEGEEGLVHISELNDSRVNQIEDICNVGDQIVVKCIGLDDRGRVRLSRKAVICEEKGLPYEVSEVRTRRSGGFNDNRGGFSRGRRGPGGSGFGGGNRGSFGGERRGGFNNRGGSRGGGFRGSDF